MDIRIESVNKDSSHSWVRISHGLNKVVTDLSNKDDDDNEQETSEMKSEQFALKNECTCFCEPIKGKAKPRRRTSACSSTRTVPMSITTKTYPALIQGNLMKSDWATYSRYDSQN